MPLDLTRIKERQRNTESRQMGNFFKAQEGRNMIRVFAFSHKVTKDDVARGLFPKEKLGKTVEELDRPVSRFFTKGQPPTLHLSDNDPMYKQYQHVLKSKGKDAAQGFRPSLQFMINIVDINDPDKGVIEYGAPKTVYHAILGYVLDPEYGETILGCAGRDFIIEYNSKADGAQKYSVKLRDEKKCEALPESVEEGVKDFYDPEVFSAFGSNPEGVQTAGDEEESDEKDSVPKVKGRPVDPDADEEEEDDLEDLEEEEEEEEEEVRPKKTAPKKR